MPPTTIWRLRRRAERRFASGHPWVFSSDLLESPKGLPPGHPVELRSAADAFLAWGYGNPHSLIAFRELSRDPRASDVFSTDTVVRRLVDAAKLRRRLGFAEASHRLCFGEADFLPGLVVDRYRLDGPPAQVLVVQVLTAGMRELMPDPVEVLHAYVDRAGGEGGEAVGWDATAVVLRNDVRIRELEGLPLETPAVLRGLSGVDLESASARLAAGSGAGSLVLSANLVAGQKTGLFLDQRTNVELLLRYLEGHAGAGGVAKVLDLFCYVGHWGAQIARHLAARGTRVEVWLADGSEPALELARSNVERQGGVARPVKMDVVANLARLEDRDFDVVVCDPPAFVRTKKDLPAGTRAYLKVNAEALRRVRDGGLIVSCSCSHHLSEEDFAALLADAARSAGASVRWIARGHQAADHPVLLAFPEGRYLEAWIGVVARGPSAGGGQSSGWNSVSRSSADSAGPLPELAP